MFPGPTLLSAISAIIEAALNRALELDPAGHKARCRHWRGRPVQPDRAGGHELDTNLQTGTGTQPAPDAPPSRSACRSRTLAG